jgi:uncharacterized protein (DUF2141 family)
MAPVVKGKLHVPVKEFQVKGFSFAAAFLSCLLLSANAKSEETRVVVNLDGVSEAGGNLRGSLYRDPDTFRKEDRAVQVVSVPATKGSSRIVFEAVPPGRYAVMVYHDENADGKLNLRFGMFPLEGYGLSNNPKVMGPPKFAASAFEVGEQETTVNIRLNY